MIKKEMEIIQLKRLSKYHKSNSPKILISFIFYIFGVFFVIAQPKISGIESDNICCTESDEPYNCNVFEYRDRVDSIFIRQDTMFINVIYAYWNCGNTFTNFKFVGDTIIIDYCCEDGLMDECLRNITFKFTGIKDTSVIVKINDVILPKSKREMLQLKVETDSTDLYYITNYYDGNDLVLKSIENKITGQLVQKSYNRRLFNIIEGNCDKLTKNVK